MKILQTAIKNIFGGEIFKDLDRFLGFVFGLLEGLAVVGVVLILMKDDTNFEMISVYLVFLQLGIMVLTIIPTEFLLHKHFTK